MEKGKITLLYERFDPEEKMQENGDSISEQKKLLEDYARKNGFPNPVHFADDGIPGTCYDRPALSAMMKEIEAGRAEALLVKNTGRLGQDYFRVGQILGVLRMHGVRLVSVEDGVDSITDDNIFPPFRSIINGYCAKDSSRKIKALFQEKGKSGRHLTGTVIYGYLWDEKRENWIVDEEAAAIVRRIYALAMEGRGPSQIAAQLSHDQVEIPSVHLARYGEGVNRNKTVKNRYGWAVSTVTQILKKREYLGHTIIFKTRKRLGEKSRYVDEEQWTVFENTHEAIISQELFDHVQRIRASGKRFADDTGKAALLTGILYCADCGAKMYVHRINRGRRTSQYTCSNYSRSPAGTFCTSQHRINESTAVEQISDTIRAIERYAAQDPAGFARSVRELRESCPECGLDEKRQRIAAINTRINELEKLTCRIYEDNVLGKLPDTRYTILDAQYSEERNRLSREKKDLEAAVSDGERSRTAAESFIALVDRYRDFDTLTDSMLHEFVDKIYVHERRRKGSKSDVPGIEIFFNFVGKYMPPHCGETQLSAEEAERQQKREDRREQLHQAYLRRKERNPKTDTACVPPQSDRGE